MKNGITSSLKKKVTPALSGNANVFASSSHKGNSKYVSNPASNFLSQSAKDPKKKLMCDSSIKKSKKKTKSHPGIASSICNDTAGNNIPSMKQNYRTGPSMKNPSFLIVDENKFSISKENFYSTKVNEMKDVMMISDNFQQKGSLVDKKAQSTATTKNLNGNLWRKPLVIGTQTSSTPDCGKNYIKISKKGNCNYNATPAPPKQGPGQGPGPNTTCTNVLSTNSTENTKDKEILIDYKNTSPSSIRFLDSPDNIGSATKFKHNHQSPTDNILQMPPSFDILASIQHFQTLLKSNEHTFQLEKLMQSDEYKNKITQLNIKLNTLNQANASVFSSSWKEKYNKVNVINANMLDGFCQNVNNPQLSYKLRNIREEEENAMSFKSTGKASEVCINSELRIKRYEVLFDFLQSNLKEMSQMMRSSDKGIFNHRKEDVDDNNTNQNKLSSLHSKINLTKTNLNNENIYDIEDSEMREKSNIIVPVGNLDMKENCTATLNTFGGDITKQQYNHQYNIEMSPSLLISTMNSDLYKFLLDETTTNLNGQSHLSNEMCSIMTQNENIQKLERMISLDKDRNPNRNVRAHHTKMNSDDITLNNRDREICRGVMNHPNQRRSIAEEDVNYREGEENVDESDIDRTRENIELFVERRNGNNRGMENVKSFMKSSNVKPQSRAEEKPKDSAKCTVF